jgi:DNA polymerase III subunit epsilon
VSDYSVNRARVVEGGARSSPPRQWRASELMILLQDHPPHLRRAHRPGAVLARRGDRLAWAVTTCEPFNPQPLPIANGSQVRDIRGMEPTLEQMARSLVESGDYRVTSRLEPQAEYHPPDDIPKLVAAVVDVETTGTNPDRDKIIELGICLFEYESDRIYRVLGSWGWFEDPGNSISPEITKITGITDEMVAGHRIDDRSVNDLLGRIVLVIAHNADRAIAGATVHALAQRLPGTGRLALQALLEQARSPTWRLWERDAAIEKKDVLKARGYSWSAGDKGRLKCWYRDVSDADKAAEVSWLRANVMGPDQAIWALRITAKDRYSDRCWGWGECLELSVCLFRIGLLIASENLPVVIDLSWRLLPT